MAATPEHKVKDAVRKLLKEYTGIYSFWPVQVGYGQATIDCMGCYRGRFFGIETKAPGEKPTPRQRLTIAAIIAAGGAVFVIAGDVSELRSWLDTTKGLSDADHDLPRTQGGGHAVPT